MNLYDFIGHLCALSTETEEEIVSQWGEAAIVVWPGVDAFSVYRATVAQETDGSLDPDSFLA